MTPFTLFLCVIMFFHTSEFALACIYMREELSFSSLLFSKQYCIAMGSALVEFCLEAWLFPGMKQMGVIPFLGFLTVLLGEVIRKTGMVTAGSNFTHNIRVYRDAQHTLVTYGIYRYVRHPGYLGWYVWCIGTQLLLVNPLSCIAFAYVSWRFFRTRIEYEESYLRRFFGQEYVTYASKTPTWLPYIP